MTDTFMDERGKTKGCSRSAVKWAHKSLPIS